MGATQSDIALKLAFREMTTEEVKTAKKQELRDLADEYINLSEEERDKYIPKRLS
jgi:hypothetical protein